MRTWIACLLLVASAPAFAIDCPKCTPGTSPAKYKATFSNGVVVVMKKDHGLRCTWTEGERPSCDFHHTGLSAFSVAGVDGREGVFIRVFNRDKDVVTGFLATAASRDGSGPWTITLKDIRDNVVGTVTVVALP
jgi:hypothetical protein